MNKQLGKYELLGQISPGGYTQVYRAVEHMGHGITRPAAVKILSGWALNDEEQLEELRREVNLLIELGTNTHIVTVYHFDIDPEMGPWIAMELLGASLRHAVSEEPGNQHLVRTVLHDVLKGLHSMHTASPRVIHRDIKPHNILPDPSGLFKIADFGLAVREESGGTLDRVSVEYAAPELLDSSQGPETPAIDLYSLGMTCYELALGRTLFRKQFPSIFDPQADPDDTLGDLRPKWMFWQCSKQGVPPISSIIEDFPKDLSDLTASLMAKPLSERLESAEEGLARLGDTPVARGDLSYAPAQAQGGRPSPRRTTTAAAASSSLPPRTRNLLVATVALVLLVGAAWFLLDEQMSQTEILLPQQSFEAQSALVPVRGRIKNMPSGAQAKMFARDIGEFPVQVDSEGNFRGDVRLAQVSQAPVPVELKVRQGGRDISTALLSVRRLPPDSVIMDVLTEPSVSGASVRIVSVTDPAAPEGRGTTDSDGSVPITMDYGRVEVNVEHPRFEPLVWTIDTGADAVKVVEATLVELPTEVVDRRRDQLMEQLKDAAARAAAGDPDALAELERLRNEMKALGDDGVNAGVRAAIVDEMVDLARRAGEGDATAAQKLKDRQTELAALGDESALAERRKELAAEIDRLAALAAGGDAGAAARLKELSAEMDRLDAKDRNAGGPAGAIARERAEILSGMADLAERAAAGDPDAQAELRALKTRLAALQAQEEALSGGNVLASNPVIDKRKREIRAEMDDLMDRAAQGDTDAARRLRELQKELAALQGNDQSDTAKSRAALLEEMARIAADAANGDPHAQARMRQIKDDLARLDRDDAIRAGADAAETLAGDPSYFSGSTADLGQVLPSLELVDRAVLLRLPQSQFKAYVERNIPLDTLTFTDVLELKKVRVSGVVLSTEEERRLADRLSRATDRLELEVVADPPSVCRQLAEALRSNGAEGVRVHAHPVGGELVVFARYDLSDEMPVDTAKAIARRYVLSHHLIDVVALAPEAKPTAQGQ